MQDCAQRDTTPLNKTSLRYCQDIHKVLGSLDLPTLHQTNAQLLDKPGGCRCTDDVITTAGQMFQQEEQDAQTHPVHLLDRDSVTCNLVPQQGLHNDWEGVLCSDPDGVAPARQGLGGPVIGLDGLSVAGSLLNTQGKQAHARAANNRVSKSVKFS